MKLLHLADLHIGKRVNEYSMVEEQTQALLQAFSMAIKNQVSAVLIAGDVYDKPVPSIEAVRLFDTVLTAFAKKGIPVMAVSGNHDSQERLTFGRELFANAEVYFSDDVEKGVKKVTFSDEFGEVDFYLLPFVRPQQVKTGENSIAPDYTAAVAALLAGLPVDRGRRNVLLAHQFVAGAGEQPFRTDSETVSVGGVDAVDWHVFEGFDYVALGHLHGAQSVGRSTIRYAGSPVKYSFSEARQEKSATLVTLEKKGCITLEKLLFSPKHDMREIRGTFEALTSPEVLREADTEDYLHVTLTDEEEIYDVFGRLRAVYPNLMQLDFDNRRTRAQGAGEVTAKDIREKNTLELFGEFYLEQTGSEMNGMQQAIMRDIIEEDS